MCMLGSFELNNSIETLVIDFYFSNLDITLNYIRPLNYVRCIVFSVIRIITINFK